MSYYSAYTFATGEDACGNAARDTGRNNDIRVLKGVYRITVCTAGLGLQGHPIGFSNHFHFFGFNVEVLLSHFLFYFMLLLKVYAATLHGTTSLYY